MIYLVLTWLGFLAGFVVGLIWHTVATEERAADELRRRILLTMYLHAQTHQAVYLSRDGVEFLQPADLN